MTRVLIIVFDALRPEFVTPDLMPNLHAFARRGVYCTNHHSTFPTETRVNQSAVITGCYPQKHGVVANNFPLPGAAKVVKTGDDLAFETMLGTMDGPLLETPTLGQILRQHGKAFASISAGTSGGGRLINLDAESLECFRFTLRRPEASVPFGVQDRIAARVGAIPEYQQPAVAWNQHAVDVWLEYVEPDHSPDVSLLWLCEPDETFHWHGIGSPESLEAIRGVDTAFGTILYRKADAISDGSLQIIAMSDHGQVSLAGAKLNLASLAREAGFDVDGSPPEYLISVHNAGGIWVRNSAHDRIGAMVRWLQGQPFAGQIFTRNGIAETLTHADVLTEHPRAPDIYLTLAQIDGLNTFGIEGRSADDAPYPEDGGCHGGLSRFELHNFLAMAGSAFQQNIMVRTQTGNVDILPTVMNLLGIPLAHQVDGRCLTETLVGGHPVTFKIETLKAGVTRLQISQVGDTRYLDQAWTELS